MGSNLPADQMTAKSLADVRIEISECHGLSRLFIATSPDLKGLHLASTDREAIEAQARKMAAELLAATK